MEDTLVVFPKSLLIRFINLYKEQRCLWDRASPDYRIKAKKQDALAKLTCLVQEFDPNATRVHILRKIDSLRACVRREYKRVVESRNNASCDEEVYTPNLWYYDLLRFVFEDSNSSAPVQNAGNNEDSEEDSPVEDNAKFDNEYQHFAVPLTMVQVREVNDQPTSSKKHNLNEEDPFKGKRAKTSTEVDDEYDAIGINVAAKLRYLPPNMRILAEKLINDVLFQAQLNGLNSSTKLVTSDPFNQFKEE